MGKSPPKHKPASRGQQRILWGRIISIRLVRCRPRVRGLVCFGTATQGTQTRPGLHAVVREYAGLCASVPQPRARILALGYTLSPASTGSYQLRW